MSDPTKELPFQNALISAAVTGKIDVRDWQAPEPGEPQTEDNS